jgi:hypothetical protein
VPIVTPRARRLVAPLAVAVATVAATAYVGLVDPNEPGHYPVCPTKALTGLDCPFCGGLRATHALAHGDLGSAIDHNALVALVIVPALVIAWFVWLRRAWLGTAMTEHSEETSAGGPSETRSRLQPALFWSAVALVVAFTVVRNIDAVPVLAWLGSSA